MSSFNETISVSSLQAGVGSVDTTAEALDSAIASRKAGKGIHIKNTHASQNLFVGNSAVSSTLGFEIGPDETVFLQIDDPTTVFVVGSGASTTYTWLSY